MRRKNEADFIALVKNTLEEVRARLDETSLIFWNPTVNGRHLLQNSCINLGDEKLRSIQLTTYRPSLAEVQRVYDQLTKVYPVGSGQSL